ncbi:hypothetical protein NL676_039376 [Syzygium grande]|nr:hypothetical protein NL676_039376 [Syzygium grande]
MKSLADVSLSLHDLLSIFFVATSAAIANFAPPLSGAPPISVIAEVLRQLNITRPALRANPKLRLGVRTIDELEFIEPKENFFKPSTTWSLQPFQFSLSVQVQNIIRLLLVVASTKIVLV